MRYRAWFQCINPACGETYPLNEIIYHCDRCRNLLEVKHDMRALQQRNASSWKSLFDKRYHRNIWPFGSSVWGKKELVCPNVEDNNIVSTYEGASNLFWADRLGQALGLQDLWIKQCGNSHTGSFKDLGMTVLVSMVKQMIAEGKDIRAVACASTGDTSAALAAYGAASGIPTIVFLPYNRVSTAQLVQPLSNGAVTLSLETDFDGCMRIVQKICREHNIYLANSMNSLRIEGQKTISIELLQQFDWEVPDTIIIPGGNLGNVSALGKGFLIMHALGLITTLPRIVVAQAANANPLYRSYRRGFKTFRPIKARKTLASAIQIGDPVSRDKAIRTLEKFRGIVEQATENELANAAAYADRTGLYNCPHTGVALAVLQKLLKRGVIGKRERVIVISTAHGLKFSNFKREYHEGTLPGVNARYANLPIRVKADYGEVTKAIFSRLP